MSITNELLSQEKYPSTYFLNLVTGEQNMSLLTWKVSLSFLCSYFDEFPSVLPAVSSISIVRVAIITAKTSKEGFGEQVFDTKGFHLCPANWLQVARHQASENVSTILHIKNL